VQTILGSTEKVNDEDNFKYFFNDVGVSENTWEKGIETWLKVLKARKP